MQQRLPIFAHSSLPPFRTVAFVRVLYVPFIRWRFVCRLFISTVFALARIIFCTCRPRRHVPFTSVQRSSFVYVVLSLTRRSPSLRSLCGRCSRSINFRWFVFCTCCVCVCVRECACVCVSDEFFCVYHFFCRPPSSDVDVGVGVVLFGAAGRVIFFLLYCSCCYMCCTSVCLCVCFTWRHFHCIRHKLFITLSLLSLTFVSYVCGNIKSNMTCINMLTRSTAYPGVAFLPPHSLSLSLSPVPCAIWPTLIGQTNRRQRFQQQQQQPVLLTNQAIKNI